MKALIRDVDGTLAGIVYDINGIDMTGLTVFEPVPESPHEYVWHAPTQQFVSRPPTEREAASTAVRADQLWPALDRATPAQIDTWLTNNVTDLVSARRVLRFLLLAVRTLRARDGL